MKVIQRDRILGINAEEVSLSTFSAGNMLDDSSRNVWVSGKISDTLTVDCNSQVSSFFLGNMLVDSANYSFFKNTLTVSSLTASGTTATCTVTYTGDRTSTASQPFTTGYYVRVTNSNNSAFNIDNKALTMTSWVHSSGTTTGIFTFTLDSSVSATSANHVVQIYQKEGDVTLRQKSFATRYFSSLSDFVQGVFVQSVSSFQDLPYDDEASKLEINLSNNVDRRANFATYWFDDGDTSNRQTPVSVSGSVTYNFNSSGVGSQTLTVTQSSHGYSVGDSIVLAGVTGSPATELNISHFITEVLDSNTWKAGLTASGTGTGTASGSVTASKTAGAGQLYSSRGRVTRTPVTITSFVTASGTATITYPSTHGLVNGDKIIIDGSSTSNVDGTYLVTYGSSSTVTVTTTASNGTASGTIKSYRPINILEFTDIMIGGFIRYTDPLSNTFDIQIMSIRGDGTASGDIKINGSQATGAVTALYLPVYAGILKAGFSLEFPNAQVGLTAGNKDYSVKKELPTGSYYYLNREVSKEFSGSFTGTPQQTEKFISFAQTQMGSPFACLVLQDMGLNEKTALFAYFTETPSESFSNQVDTIREVNFSMREVL